MDQNRLKSPAAWAAVAALASVVVQIFVGKDISVQVNVIWAAIETVLLSFGIFNNPTAKGKF